eukprot:2116508-Prorocentrum_lima.AAC.1
MEASTDIHGLAIWSRAHQGLCQVFAGFLHGPRMHLCPVSWLSPPSKSSASPLVHSWPYPA